MKTLFQEMMDYHNQEDGFKENTRIGPVLEITTSYLYGKHEIEIRIWSLRKDNSHSWVRISHGSNKFVIDSNYNNTEIPADLHEEQASQSGSRLLQPDQRQKQNHKREKLLNYRALFQ